MRKAPRVFIIEHVRNYIDVSKARRYGEIVYLFDRNDRRCSVWEHPRFGQKILQLLETYEFDPEIDSICVAGAMLTVSIAIIVVSQNYDFYNVLLFNSVESTYTQRRINKEDWKGNSYESKSGTTVESH